MSVRAVMAREVRAGLLPGGRPTWALLGGVLMAALFGVGGVLFAAFMSQLVPVETLSVTARVWSAAAMGMAGAALMAAISPLTLAADSIAGERERHTLNTLLATPATDMQIFWGKTLAMHVATTVAALTGGLLAGITVTILFGMPGLPLLILAPLGALLLALPLGFVEGCWGMLMSLRARTVKDASQRMMFFILPTVLLPQVAGAAASFLDPPQLIALWGFMGLAAMALAVVGPVLVMTRFRRDRLLV